MGNTQPPQQNHETLKVSTSSDPHHFPKMLLIGFAVILIIIIGAGLGYFLGLKNTQEISSQDTNQIVKPSPTPIDETANWKTYTNEKYKFTFKYPSNVSIVGDTGNIANNKILGQVISLKGPDLDMDVNFLIGIPSESIIKSTETVTLNNLKWNLMTVEPGSCPPGLGQCLPLMQYQAQINNNLVSFTFREFINRSLFNSIVSTFKFTDQILTPTPTPPAYQIIEGNELNTYTNNIYSFSFNFQRSLFIYNSQSNSENASFLEKQENINAVRMGVEVFKNPNNLTLEQVEAKYDLKVRYNQTFDLEKTTISGKEALLVAGNKSLREVCGSNDDQQRRIVLAALVKGSNFVLVFTTNNTCDTFQTDWFSTITKSINLK